MEAAEMYQLEGLKGDHNAEYRKQFFQGQVRALYEKHKKLPEDPESVLVEDFSFSIDEALGVDFSKAKKEELQTYQYGMLKQKSSLDRLYEKGLLDKLLYVEQVANTVEKSLYRAAKLLTDEEFESLFSMKKDQVSGVFYRLVNVGLPDHEKIVDTRKNSEEK
jgi:hypothetical protein